MQSLRYVLYARKSTESNERQVQSIDDQVKVLKALASSYGLHVAHILVEAKSAKAPDKRTVFTKALRLIEEGEADALLCWKYDRLSRNPMDSGRLSYMLQNSVIKEIRTIERTYKPDDNALLLSVEGGMANQYIRELSKNVKRGMNSKVEKGWSPGVPPIGYLNDVINHTIVLDEERSWIVRIMFDLLFSGYSIRYIVDYVNTQLGFRTIKRRNSGGVTLGHSTLYAMFKNPFYCGFFRWNGELMQGAHEPIVSLEEHQQALELTSNKHAQRPKGELMFLYRGMIKCGECGCAITAELKSKQTKKGISYYTYYRCTHKRKDYVCKQMPIKLENIENQLIEEMAQYEIIPEFYEWALDTLGELHEQEKIQLCKVHSARSKAVTRAENDLQELLQMRIRKLIDDDEYKNLKSSLLVDIRKLKGLRDNAEQVSENWFNTMETKLNMARTARLVFIHGSDEKKRDLLSMFGQEFTLRDRELNLKPEPWLIPIKRHYKKLESDYLRLELNDNKNLRSKKATLVAIQNTWQG